MGTAAIEADLSGRTCVVTGATAGIGKEIARGLARLGASVVLPCRSLERGGAAADEIARDARGGKAPLVLEADLSRQASIRAFARALLERHPRVHVLVNNAGVWPRKREVGPDGIELTFATNVLGYHLLTKLLQDALRASAPARIVNVASTLARGLDLDDLEFQRRGYEGTKAYAQSKQANRMLTWALAERLAASGVTANAAHPGFVRSELARDYTGIAGLAVGLAQRLFAKTPEQGGDTPLWLAASPEVEGVTGKLFAGRRELRCAFRDPTPIARLWDACERMTAEKR